jgi:putative redox protein
MRDTTVTLLRPEALAVAIESGPHRLEGDEQKEVGGEDSGPSPYDYLCIALGCCTTMTLELYSKRKQWPLEGVKTVVRHHKEGDVDHMERVVTLSGPLSDEQRTRLIEIANKCPVHKTLTAGVKVATKLG